MQEARVADPAAPLDEFAVHQGDLTSWAAEAEPADPRPHARGFRQTDRVVGCLCRSGPGPPARNADHGCASVGGQGFLTAACASSVVRKACARSCALPVLQKWVK